MHWAQLTLTLVNLRYVHGLWTSPSRDAFVRLSSGMIRGQHAPSGANVVEYLGVPYGHAERFESPQLAAHWTGTLDATSYGPDCPASRPNVTVAHANVTFAEPRLLKAFNGEVVREQSEDCLSLNVWVPKCERSDLWQPKAVMLWYYGGFFQIGQTNNPFYYGAHLAAEQDVIVVTPNFRSNIFGYPGAEGLSEQNLGLADQRLALKWVRDNVRAFGGDPRKITLFGQSSGGIAVDVQSYAYSEDPIAHAYISESGVVGTLPFKNQSAAAKLFYGAAHYAGCTDAKEALECMKEKTLREVLAAINHIGSPDTPIWGPIIDDNVVFSPEAYAKKAAAGQYANVPYLMGNNQEEASIFALEEPVLSNKTYQKVFTDGFFTCQNSIQATARSAYSRNYTQAPPTWRYMYNGSFPNLDLYPGSGAWHGAEIPMIFNTAKDITGQPNTKEENKAGKYMRTAWASFARNPHTALTNLGWPESGSTEDDVVLLGNEDNNVGFDKASTFDAYCAEEVPAAKKYFG